MLAGNLDEKTAYRMRQYQLTIAFEAVTSGTFQERVLAIGKERFRTMRECFPDTMMSEMTVNIRNALACYLDHLSFLMIEWSKLEESGRNYASIINEAVSKAGGDLNLETDASPELAAANEALESIRNLCISLDRRRIGLNSVFEEGGVEKAYANELHKRHLLAQISSVGVNKLQDWRRKSCMTHIWGKLMSSEERFSQNLDLYSRELAETRRHAKQRKIEEAWHAQNVAKLMIECYEFLKGYAEQRIRYVPKIDDPFTHHKIQDMLDVLKDGIVTMLRISGTLPAHLDTIEHFAKRERADQNIPTVS